MSDNKLIIDGNKLIRDAFYAIPDFTDADGNPQYEIIGLVPMYGDKIDKIFTAQ